MCYASQGRVVIVIIPDQTRVRRYLATFEAARALGLVVGLVEVDIGSKLVRWLFDSIRYLLHGGPQRGVPVGACFVVREGRDATDWR